MSQPSAHPRLIGLTGVVSGEVVPLAGTVISIGRDAGNSLALADPAVSRRHCLITRSGEACEIRDLDSANGTFVNGVQVTAHPLTAGDRIAIGGSVFVYMPLSAAPPPTVDEVQHEVLTTVTRLAAADASYLSAADTASTGRTEKGLRELLAFSAAIHTVRTQEELAREVLAAVRALVPAERMAFILLRPHEEWEIVSGGSEDHVSLSRDLVARVLRERTGILSRDAAISRTFAAERPTLGSTHSLICVPLVVRDASMGAIYIVNGRRGAFDDDHLQLVTAIARLAALALGQIRHLATIEHEASRLHADLQLKHTMVGRSAPMEQIYRLVTRVAHVNTTVLITGESGTGKELAARALHLNSPRARRPFVAINCAAITETLVESDLFGHERGAFSGAVTQKKGRLEVADGGTVFLDEVGELPPSIQGKLLRVLQEHEFERVGGTRTIRVDIRVIAATNRDLQAEVRADRFREDLYHRLNVIAFKMPPLRERRDDIVPLATHFLDRYARKCGRRLTGFSEAALEALRAYDWPGNVRELENAIERAVVFALTDEIVVEDLPDSMVDASTAARPVVNAMSFRDQVVEAKKTAIIWAFHRSGGSYAKTARALGLHPNYLFRLIKTLRLRDTLEGGGGNPVCV